MLPPKHKHIRRFQDPRICSRLTICGRGVLTICAHRYGTSNRGMPKCNGNCSEALPDHLYQESDHVLAFSSKTILKAQVPASHAKTPTDVRYGVATSTVSNA